MTKPPVPTLESLRGEDSVDLTATRQRAIEAMGSTVVGLGPTGTMSARTFLTLIFGGDAIYADQMLRLMAQAYDVEMCAEWGRRIKPIPITAPKPRWKRWRDGFLGVAMPWLAGYGAFIIAIQIIAAVVEAVQ